jgi:hypothetical protein
MRGKVNGWESELWLHLSNGDGTHCPMYQSCQHRLNGFWCLGDHKNYYKKEIEFIDRDESDWERLTSIQPDICHYPTNGRIFELVYRLAKKYHEEAELDHLPVPDDLITIASDNLPIEVRRISLKATHGAVWRLKDCWLIHLNSNDSPPRQRFTLYHEIFHILAHCRGTPVFKKQSHTQEGYFNEMLADRFSTAILLPKKWLKRMWLEVGDVNKLGVIFNVPKSLVYLELRYNKLI